MTTLRRLAPVVLAVALTVPAAAIRAEPSLAAYLGVAETFDTDWS